MAPGDSEFLRQVGILPCVLHDPFPKPMPPPTSRPIYIPSLTQFDAKFLGSLLVSWEPDPEGPDFTPPPNLESYLAKYPRGIYEALIEICTALKVSPMYGLTFEDVTKKFVEMYRDFAVDLEDIVATRYVFPSGGRLTWSYLPSQGRHAELCDGGFQVGPQGQVIAYNAPPHWTKKPR